MKYFLGNTYLTPWTPDDEKYKDFWWHKTLFAYGPLTANMYWKWTTGKIH